MGRDGSQSPDPLLPEKTNRSDILTQSNRSCSFHVAQPFRNCSFNANSPPPRPPPPQPQAQTPWLRSLSPIRRTYPVRAGGAATADGIPLYPCLPSPYSCHHDYHSTSTTHNSNDNDENLRGGGIMALTNFSYGSDNKNQGNTPVPRKLTLDVSSPESAPIITAMDDTPTPTCPPQTPPEQCVAIYRFSHKLQWLIPIMLMVQSIIFLISMYENDCPHTYYNPKRCMLRFLSRFAFQPLKENPLLGPSSKTLLSVGAINSHLVTNSGQGWRLLTAVWLHAGLFHLLANTLGLLVIGRRLEREFGWIKLAAIYLLAGFGGNLLSALFVQNQVSVGASGALMGLLGATAAEMVVNRTPAPKHHRRRLLVASALTLAINFTFGLMPHVDNFAHIGGFCAGPLLGVLLLMRPRSEIELAATLGGEVPTTPLGKYSGAQDTARIVALGLLVLGYAMAILALFKGYGMSARGTCKWCQYLSCASSSLWHCRSV